MGLGSSSGCTVHFSSSLPDPDVLASPGPSATTDRRLLENLRTVAAAARARGPVGEDERIPRQAARKRGLEFGPWELDGAFFWIFGISRRVKEGAPDEADPDASNYEPIALTENGHEIPKECELAAMEGVRAWAV